MNIMDYATTVGAQAQLSQLPLEFQHALKFARAHDLVVILGHVEDEGIVFLATVPEDVEPDEEDT